MGTIDNGTFSNSTRSTHLLDEKSYGSVLNEVITSVKDVMRSEVNLFATEFKQLQPNLTKHIAQATMFGWLLAVSVLPMLAFLVIGLGELLDGRYWLSSLIVGILCAAIGGSLALKAFSKIKNEDFNFNQTKRSLHDTMQTTAKTFDKVKAATKGNLYGSKFDN